MSSETYLKGISIQNFRCFCNLNVEFDRKLTVVIANNGFGKSALLDALAITLEVFVAAFHNRRPEGIRKTDVRLEVIPNDVLQMEPQYPSVIDCRGVFNGDEIQWQRKKSSADSYTRKGANSIIKLSESLRDAIRDRNNGQITLPLIAYYGTGRVWQNKTIKDKQEPSNEVFSRLTGYIDCIDSYSSYRRFADWFLYTSLAHAESRLQNEEKHGEQGLKMPTPYSERLDAIIKAVDCCLANTGWTNLKYSSIHKAIMIEHNVHGSLQLNQLSDGIKNTVAMVADIAHRAIRLNSHFKGQAPIETSGIVLIDEIDLHLHPSWQQRILSQLAKAFPKLQFIVTTHSPQVLSGVKRNNIRVLGTSIEGEQLAAVPLAESYARSNENVLQGVMDVDPVPPFPEKYKLQKYIQLIEQGDIKSRDTMEEINDMKQQLEKALGVDHPELIRLEMVRERREVLE